MRDFVVFVVALLILGTFLLFKEAQSAKDERRRELEARESARSAGEERTRQACHSAIEKSLGTRVLNWPFGDFVRPTKTTTGYKLEVLADLGEPEPMKVLCYVDHKHHVLKLSPGNW